MASWRDNLRPASFRGVPFYVDVSQYTGGRRVALHEFPDRDESHPEDTGGVGKTYKVDGHILGDDYFETKKRLIEALEKPGPGELIHPYYGTLLVQIGPVSIDEDTREGRIAKVSFQAYKATVNLFPRATNDKAAVLESKAGTAMDAIKKDFDDAFSIAKAPGFVVDTARAALGKIMDLFTKSTKGVRTNADQIAALAFGIRNFRAELSDLMAAPGKLSQRMLDSFSLLEDAVDLDRGKLKAARVFFGYGLTETLTGSGTPSRDREAANKTALDNFVRRASVVKAVQASAAIEYDSSEEALETRESLVKEIDAILLASTNDEVFVAFEDLQAVLSDAVPDVDSDLPNLRTVTPRDTVPSIVLTYDLFEAPDNEADLIARNKIRNPAFVAAGKPLEVLDDRAGA